MQLGNEILFMDEVQVGRQVEFGGGEGVEERIEVQVEGIVIWKYKSGEYRVVEGTAVGLVGR